MCFATCSTAPTYPYNEYTLCTCSNLGSASAMPTRTDKTGKHATMHATHTCAPSAFYAVRYVVRRGHRPRQRATKREETGRPPLPPKPGPSRTCVHIVPHAVVNLRLFTSTSTRREQSTLFRDGYATRRGTSIPLHPLLPPPLRSVHVLILLPTSSSSSLV